MTHLLVQFLVILAVSVVAGVIGSLLGLGGGIIVIPALTLFLHVDFRIAAGASIVSIIATSSGSAATYVKDRLSNIRVGMFLEILTSIGAVCGAFLAGVVKGSALYVVFALVLLYSLYPMGKKIALELGWRLRPHGKDQAESLPPDPLAAKLGFSSTYYDPAAKREISYDLHHVPAGAGIMYFAGLASGLLGIGSGVFKVVALDTAMGMPMKASTATSNFMIGVTAAASAGIYFLRGDIDPLIAAPVALGVLAGSLVGTRLLARLAGASIRIIFFVVLAIIAIQMLLRGFNISL
ncbi:MAG TPA: sulfite exporter TauE/SafE family protein [Rectinemataceae bacterium]|nr:sulfite exporter TauE/SafE family protein [Rectinemataceae bacterium]